MDSRIRSNILTRLCSVVLAMPLALLAVVSAAAPTSAYPTKTITLVVPYGPGGSSDIVARFLGDALGKELGKPVVVVNKPGGGGNVGWKELAVARPDGYTLAVLTKALVIQRYTTTSGISHEDLQPVAKLVTSLGAIAVKSDSGFKDLKDFLVTARNAPGKIRVSNSGAGATWDLFTGAMENATGIRFIRVPYEGGNPAVVAVAGGHVEATAMDLPSIAALLPTQRLRLLAINSERRHEKYPDVPTFKEQGLDITWDHWTGIGAPKGTPGDVVKKLAAALKKITDTPAWKAFADRNTYTPSYLGPGDWAGVLAGEDAQIRSLVATMDLKK